jgi:glyoxylase-like metal-dependent hydrolase (beta-lactamase superfamily II)
VEWAPPTVKPPRDGRFFQSRTRRGGYHRVMAIHHVNCGTMCPTGKRIIENDGGLFERARMVCHVLVVETDQGLVLVDTGLGTRDIDEPARLGRGFLRRSAPLDRAETALAHVERLGYRASDVRHVVATHLDLDHVGGISDFPDATVHVLVDEHAAAMDPRGPSKRYGYRPAQWAHGPRWQRHAVDGEQWNGFGAVRVVPGLSVDVLLIPLVGHSAGHCGVAVRDGERWLLHAGDAYFSHLEIDPVAPATPLGLALFQRMRSVDERARRSNQVRLRQLVRDHGDVDVFCAHDARELARYALR